MPLTFTDAAELTEVSAPGASAPTHAVAGSRGSGGLSAPKAQDEAATESGPDFPIPGLLRALRRRWYVIFPLAAVAGAVAGWLANAFLATPSSTARTLLHVSADRPRILFDSGEGRSDFANYQRSQAATVKSRWVLRSALAQLEGQNLTMLQGVPDPVGFLEKQIQADYSIAPEIMRIMLKGDPPDELLIVLDTIRDAYLREVLNKDRTDRQAQLEQLKALAAGHDESLRSQRRALDDKAEALGVRDPQVLRQRHQHAVSQVAAMEGELSQLQLKISRLELDIAALEKRQDLPPSHDAVEAAVDQQLAKDPVAIMLTQQIATLLSDIADYRLKGAKDSEAPGLRDKTAALEAARKSLAVQRASLVSAVTVKLQEKIRSDRRASLQRLRDELDTEKQFERLLREQTESRKRELNLVTKGIAGLESIREAIAQTEDFAKKANSRIQTLQVELQAPPRATLLEESVVVQSPNPTKQLMYTIVPALGAFMMILLGGIWLEYQTGRVSSTAEVSQRLGNVVVAAVPRVTDRVRLCLSPPVRGRDRRQHDLLTDAVDMTRALLMGAGKGDRARRVVMVTSAVPGEGKTSLAAHLALSLARTGLPTLLIDADFRCPNLHNVLGLPLGPGLSDLLQGKSQPSDVIRRQHELSVITTGQCEARAVLGLIQTQLPQVLDALKQQFEFIVVDAPPVLDLPDAILLGLNADGTILSTLRDVSRLPLLQAALDRLGMRSIPILGAVLNGAPIAAGYSPNGRR